MRVDDLDYDEIKAAVEQGHTLGDAGYEPDLDLDRDGKITNDDFALFDAWYGKTKAGAGLVSDPAGPDSRVGYAGYVFNPEALIYTVRHRHYDPMLGRFMEQDWLGYADGMNLYEYVGGRAMNFNDPSGLFFSAIWDAFSGGASTESIDDTKQKFCGKITEDRDKGKICQADFEKLWNNGGCGSSTLGEQLGGFAKETGKNVAKGAAATADGFIPFFDPFEDYYDKDDPWFQASRFFGGVAFDALSTAVGLRGAAWFGGTKVGHVLNHNRYLRIGPGRMGSAGPLPPGPRVPRISIGNGRPSRWNHFDLRVRWFD